MRIFKDKELRNRILFTALIIFIIRIGTQIPIPGVNREFFSSWLNKNMEGLGFVSALTGGSFEKMSMFALSITPYITASIIIQLLTIVIPALEEMGRDGADGKNRIAQITRYLAIGLSAMESLAMSIGLGRSGYLTEFSAKNVIISAVGMTAGACIVIWLADCISEKGIGNGISVLLLANIVSGMPKDVITLIDMFIKGWTIPRAVLNGVIICAIFVAMVIYIIYLQLGIRNVPVQYAGSATARTYIKNRHDLPIPVNIAGVMPVIFASTIMSVPVIISSIIGKAPKNKVLSFIFESLKQSNWFSATRPWYTAGFALYVLLMVFFAYFYVQISFNTMEIADNLKRQSATIPGIRAGKPTQMYLQGIVNAVTLIGVFMLIIAATIPTLIENLANISISFGGTSIIIVVGVLIEISRNIEVYLGAKSYTGFLR